MNAKIKKHLKLTLAASILGTSLLTGFPTKYICRKFHGCFRCYCNTKQVINTITWAKIILCRSIPGLAVIMLTLTVSGLQFFQ